MKKFLIAALAATLIAGAVPTAASAAVFKTEDQAESYMEREYGDYYDDEGFTLDDVTCDGFGFYRDGGDGADDRFKKFECTSDYSDEYGEEGVTDTDVLKTRAWGFKLRNIDSEWW